VRKREKKNIRNSEQEGLGRQKMILIDIFLDGARNEELRKKQELAPKLLQETGPELGRLGKNWRIIGRPWDFGEEPDLVAKSAGRGSWPPPADQRMLASSAPLACFSLRLGIKVCRHTCLTLPLLNWPCQELF
jgi:hypothetical protein